MSGHEPGAAGVRVRYRRADGGFSDTPIARVAAEDVVAGRPVREFRSYMGRIHYSGWYWSATLERLVVYESRLELARIMLADFDPDVAGIAAQPFLLSGPDGSRIRRHVPDLLLSHASGAVTLVDVKAASRLGNAAARAQSAWMARACASRGWGFEVWSGADPRLLDNVRFLAGYRRRSVIDAGLVPVVLDAAARQPQIGGIERALSGTHPPELVRPVVLHLLWAGRLTTDLTLPLGTATVVQPAGKAAA